MKDFLLATVKTVNSAAGAGKAVVEKKSDPSFFDNLFSSASLPPLELVYRGLRVLAVFFSILFTLSLLKGALKYIIDSGRDEEVSKSRALIITGAVGILAMLVLYLAASTGLFRLLSSH